MIATGSLIVKLKLMLLVAPSLLTLSWKVELDKFTVGVPYIVPLLSPRKSPAGSSGTVVQFTMLPLISVGTIGTISVPLSNTKTVWLYVTVGLPSKIEKETFTSLSPSLESFIHRANEPRDMFPSAAPEISPVSESMLSPAGSPEVAQLSRNSSQ